MKNLLSEGNKSDQLAFGLPQWFDLYEVENLHICRFQYSTEGGLIEDSPMSLL
jgi:hypothetical protein